MRYVSEEQKNLRNIYDKYLEKDSKVFFYLPDTAPQEAKEAYKKVKKRILDRKKRNQDCFNSIKSTLRCKVLF